MKDLLIDEINNVEYWKKLCPELRITNFACKSFDNEPVKLSDAEVFVNKSKLSNDGYFRLDATDLKWDPKMLKKVVRSIEALKSKGWPPHFVLVFDEIWAICNKFASILEATSNNKLNMDLLAWYIDPQKHQTGFAPHRDRMPKDRPGEEKGTAIKNSFHSHDNTPKYTSVWLPLTEATPDNSCLYFIPAFEDPYYSLGDPPDKEPLDAVLPRGDLSSLQKIRAMPCKPGSPLVFSHRLIHWAGRSDPSCKDGPRVALGLAFSDDSYEKPYFSRKYLPLPPFDLRVALAAGQSIKYNNRFRFDINVLSLFHRIFNFKSSEFDETYTLGVRGDFQFAKWKAQQQRKPARCQETKTINITEDCRRNKDDAIVEAPLEAFGNEIDIFSDLFRDSDDSEDDEIEA